MKRNFLEVKLYVLISTYLAKRSLSETLQLVIKGGADAVQLREKEMTDSEYFRVAQEFRNITAETNTLFLVNDRAGIAKEVDADGLHIGQDDISIAAARHILGDDKIIGCSTHNIMQARKAVQEGADYISVGPLFYTSTKNYESPVGLEFLKQINHEITIPYIAIGAINFDNIGLVLNAGGKRIAICSAIICNKNIEERTRSFKEIIDKHG